VRDTRSRNGTPDSGWDDDEDNLDLAGLGKTECERSWLFLTRAHYANICNYLQLFAMVQLAMTCH